MGDIDPAAASGEEEIDKKELWRGAIPTEISLAENDIATDKPLYPYYVSFLPSSRTHSQRL